MLFSPKQQEGLSCLCLALTIYQELKGHQRESPAPCGSLPRWESEASTYWVTSLFYSPAQMHLPALQPLFLFALSTNPHSLTSVSGWCLQELSPVYEYTRPWLQQDQAALVSQPLSEITHNNLMPAASQDLETSNLLTCNLNKHLVSQPWTSTCCKNAQNFTAGKMPRETCRNFHYFIFQARAPFPCILYIFAVMLQKLSVSTHSRFQVWTQLTTL